MKQFNNFVDYKHRKTIKELSTINEILKMGDFKVKKFFEDKFYPYLYVKSDVDTPFGGVRIYKIENTIAFRVQNEEKAQPYGKAMNLDVEDMFYDYLDHSKNGDTSAVAEHVAKSVIDSIKFFFKKNAELYNHYTNGDMSNVQPQVMTPPISSADNLRANGPWNSV